MLSTHPKHPISARGSLRASVVVLALSACASPSPRSPAPDPEEVTPTTPADDSAAPAARLWVSDYLGEQIVVLDPSSGKRIDRIAPVPGAQSTTPWDQGWLVAAEAAGEVLSWDPEGGLRTVITGAGHPTAAIQVGAEILVADFAGDAVNRYDAAGQPLGALATGLDGPDAGMALGPDGQVWVPLFEGDQLVRIDPGTGVVTPVAAVPGARGIAFGDGVVYVSAWGADAIRRFDLDGAALPDLASVTRPTGLALEPGGAAIWVASDQHAHLLKLHAGTGEVLADLEPRIAGGTFLTWILDGGR